jgi:drug/metabolite transporter (DMT)-like permease
MILLAKSSVVWIAAFSLTFFPDERGLIRSRNFWLAVVLSGVGVVGVLMFKADFGTKEAFTGTAIGLIASFLWAVYTVSVKIAFRKHDSRKGFGILSIYTVVGLWVLAFARGNPGECFDMAWWPWASVVISGVLSIALSHVLYYVAIRRIGATIPSLVLLVQPFVIYGISSIVFKEALNRRQLVFGLILLCGALLGILAQRDVRNGRMKLEEASAVGS